MSTRLHAATRKGVFTLERGSTGWAITRVSFLGDNATILLHDPRNGELITSLNHGHFGVKLHKSADGGVSWKEIGTPKYPEKPADYVSKAPPQFKPVEWSLKLVWALAPGGKDEPGVLWCGTLPGGLFKSEDGGESWSLNRPLWTTPGGSSGWAAEWISREFTPFVSIRGIRATSPSRFPAEAPGTPTTAAIPGN